MGELSIQTTRPTRLKPPLAHKILTALKSYHRQSYHDIVGKEKKHDVIILVIGHDVWDAGRSTTTGHLTFYNI